MRYSPLIYAKALREVLSQTDTDRHSEIVKKFVSVMSKNGDLAQGGKVLARLEEIFVMESGGKPVKIEIARELPADELEKLKKQFGNNDRIEVLINPALIAGVRITMNGERELDHSMASRLRKIFTS